VEQQKRKTSNEQQELRSFLEFVVTPDDAEIAHQRAALRMDAYLLKKANSKELVKFPVDGVLSDGQKVKLLRDAFESLMNSNVLRPLLLSWMNEAVDEGLYSSQQPKNSSPSSADRRASFETISLSSHAIDDAVAADIVQDTIFATYAVGTHHDRTHKNLCKDLSNIFRSDQSEYITAMATAEKKTDWSEFCDAEGGEASTNSHSTRSLMDKLASVAATSFAQKVDKSGLTQSQIDALYGYCFVHLKRA